MNLSVEQLEKILDASRATAQENNDKRRAARLHTQKRISIIPLPRGRRDEGKPVVMKDISCRGVGLVTEREYPDGAQFILEFGTAAEHNSILCTVVHCHQIATNAYGIGAEFTCSIQPEDANTAAANKEADRIRDSIFS